MKAEARAPDPIDTRDRRHAEQVLESAPTILTKVSETIVPPRDARSIRINAGLFFRILSVEGAQVGDLNLWTAHDPHERFYSGKTRALHGTHLGLGDCMWSTFPNLRPMATITWDTLVWYGWDADGGGVHDVIGTRCDPYTHSLLVHEPYHYCYHSNLIRSLAAATGVALNEAEPLVRDVLNVFTCTGFSLDTHQYFINASPVRPGDYLEFFAETDLLAGLSTCPGCGCGTKQSSDTAACHPLVIEVFDPALSALQGCKQLEPAPCDGSHDA